jgi:hypothetical protein
MKDYRFVTNIIKKVESEMSVLERDIFLGYGLRVIDEPLGILAEIYYEPELMKGPEELSLEQEEILADEISEMRLLSENLDKVMAKYDFVKQWSGNSVTKLSPIFYTYKGDKHMEPSDDEQRDLEGEIIDLCRNVSKVYAACNLSFLLFYYMLLV